MQLVCNLYGYFIGDQCCDARIFNYSDIRIYRRSNWIIGTYCSGYFPINSVHSFPDYALEVSRGAVKNVKGICYRDVAYALFCTVFQNKQLLTIIINGGKIKQKTA